jgi:CRISPR-associated protein Cmr4
MYTKAELFFIRTVTPTHMGSGTDLGIVDLPIQRESHTNFPKIEGSSLKGSIREAVERKLGVHYLLLLEKKGRSVNYERMEELKINELKVHAIFGFDNDKNASSNAKKKFEGKQGQFSGALSFTDGRILFFPVKSAKGVFAWITCPYILGRFKKEAEEIVNLKGIPEKIPEPVAISPGSKLKVVGNQIILEEYTFNASESPELKEWAEFVGNFFKKRDKNLAKLLPEHIVLLSDDDFRDFVEMGTEVIIRNKINNLTGVVQDGALFSEEYLPAETILYSFVMATPLFAQIEEDIGINSEIDVMNFFVEEVPDTLQMGGNRTIGKGVCNLIKGVTNG